MEQQEPGRRPAAPRQVVLLVVGMVLVAAAVHLSLAAVGRWDDRPADVSFPAVLAFTAVLLVFAVSEVFVVHLPTARSAHTHTFSEVPVVLALAFLEPRHYLLAVLVGSGLALVLHERQRGVKVSFNLGLYAVQAGIAVLAYGLVLGPADPVDVRGWAAAVVAIVLSDLVGAVLVTAVIYLAGDGLETSILREAFRSGLLAALANTSLALLLVVLVLDRPTAVPLLVVMLVVLLLAYRAYIDLAKRHTQTKSLYRFVATTAASPVGADDADETDENDDTVSGVLSEARDLLGAARAELLVRSDSGGERRVLAESGEVTRTPLTAAQYTGVADQVARGAAMTSQGSLVAPVALGQEGEAVLLVGERLFDHDPFSADDLGLISALAGHAGGVLQRADLVRRLRAQVAAREYEARHDPLTGLPNRRDVERHVGGAGSSGELALLLLGLDQFRQVNETLGHQAGDEVLVEVGRRLAHAGVGPVARVGGDEFVVLAKGVDGINLAREHAAALLAAVRRPIVVSTVDVVVGASIGIALAPEHGQSLDVLLAHADVAMDTAKTAGTLVEMYQPVDESARLRRLRLAGELAPAMPAGKLAPWYQPQVDAHSGQLVGVEALVRWDHPALGLVLPDEILPVASSTGLQRRLTDHVLAASLHDRSGWTGAWAGIGVSVNVTTRDLHDEALPSIVRALLNATRTPAAALTIEITEDGVMSDVRRCLDVLDELAEVGVRLSVDDFGTGNSSLAYLQRLPVNEVKIDKSFVRRLESSGDDTVVRATVDLAHALDLSVVVEGVENAAIWDRLCELGVDVGQGWLFGRPQPGEPEATAHPTGTPRTRPAPYPPAMIRG